MPSGDSQALTRTILADDTWRPMLNSAKSRVPATWSVAVSIFSTREREAAAGTSPDWFRAVLLPGLCLDHGVATYTHRPSGETATSSAPPGRPIVRMTLPADVLMTDSCGDSLCVT